MKNEYEEEKENRDDNDELYTKKVDSWWLDAKASWPLWVMYHYFSSSFVRSRALFTYPSSNNCTTTTATIFYYTNATIITSSIDTHFSKACLLQCDVYNCCLFVLSRSSIYQRKEKRKRNSCFIDKSESMNFLNA